MTAPALTVVETAGDDLVALDTPVGDAAAGVDLVVEAMAIAGLWAHLTTAPVCELIEGGRTCPDPAVRAAADRVAEQAEQLRQALVDAVADAYRQVQADPDAPRRSQECAGGEH